MTARVTQKHYTSRSQNLTQSPSSRGPLDTFVLGVARLSPLHFPVELEQQL